MQWLADYWWIILVLLVGVLLNAIKELRRLDVKKFLDNKPELPPHRDLNDKWDNEDDWPQKKQ
ncbi:YpfN family protein [Photorhabdus heterorhabditis]|uniref:YpfN family protein n=1 Tax=Photorhabdus heterorhabditis TaxID=880156 RepID=UPI001562E12F|nr:YpfN family protein [Photorhabdus heterorhabditis]NRN28134.1 YpfN family protein [Photorhabdus heterorhabditis subsp. aluminescens]